MTKYWVVGASWGGVDHRDQLFIEQGMWMLGWEDENSHSGRPKCSQGIELPSNE